MRGRAIALAGAAILAAAAAAPAGDAARAPRAVSVQVMTHPGTTVQAIRALRARGIRVDRRSGRRLQVVVRGAAQRRRVATAPGVATVAPALSAYPDAVRGQGVDRTGASALSDVAADGAGIRIAVLDLGFGAQIGALQAAGELPPPARLTLRSFDPAGGIAGTNAYGNPTNHGELVAQTVYDYAPRATYLFVSYHTVDDFRAAVDWLVSQRVDVVVHSNNFLEGPFDGSGPAARAVDRAAAAGILWFNSAGNYGEKHWSGPWVDGDGDGDLDWPGSAPWTVTRTGSEALTFHLSWETPAGGPTDIDLILERRDGDGGWTTIGASRDRQSAGAAAAERINGLRPSGPGVFRIRARLVSGPPPSVVTLFAREDDILILGGGTAGSVPTPADAAGSVSVGAVDWRSNSLVRYSSRGPTPDGRLKPDLAAPTGTRLATPGGDPRDVGGTSIAAPNAAGAAALLVGALRAGGLRLPVDEVRAILAGDALDLGAPGPDTTFGAGRIRVDAEPPALRPVLGPPAGPRRGTFAVAFEATDASPLATWYLEIDGVRTRVGRLIRETVQTRIATRALADGPHAVVVGVGDSVGNVRRRGFRFVADNTAPLVDVLGVALLAGPGPRTASDRPAARGVRVALRSGDAISRRVRLDATLRRVDGRLVARRTLRLRSGLGRAFLLGRAAPGVYVLRLAATDAAGNTSVVTRPVRISGARPTPEPR